MPWVRATLRGQKVYARAGASGALAEERGLVEVRYKPHDGRRYRARAANLTVDDPTPLPDDACGPAEDVQRDEAGGAAGGRAGSGARKAPARGARKGGASHHEGPAPAGALVAYADGACSGNPGPAGLGVVFIDGGRRVEISEYLGHATNNIAELTAVLRALEEAAGSDRPLLIHTDSQYTIGVLQKGWKAKANADLVLSLKEQLATRRSTRLVYVPGHSGVPLNERADALAREAVATRKTRRASLGN